MFSRNELLEAFKVLMEISASQNLKEFRSSLKKLNGFKKDLEQNSASEEYDNVLKNIDCIKHYGEDWFSGNIFDVLSEADVNDSMKILFHDSIGEIASFLSQKLQALS